MVLRALVIGSAMLARWVAREEQAREGGRRRHAEGYSSTRDGSGERSVRILVIGAGVIGSVYAAKLLQSGHEVVLLARGRRLADLQASGLVLE